MSEVITHPSSRITSLMMSVLVADLDVRLNKHCVQPDYIAGIDVPRTVPTAIVPSTRISISFIVDLQLRTSQESRGGW